MPDQEVGSNSSLPLYNQRLPLFESEVLVESPVCTWRHLDLARDAVRFHPTRGVDRVAPEVIGEFPLSNHTSDDRADVNANSKAQSSTARRAASSSGWDAGNYRRVEQLSSGQTTMRLAC